MVRRARVGACALLNARGVSAVATLLPLELHRGLAFVAVLALLMRGVWIMRWLLTKVRKPRPAMLRLVGCATHLHVLLPLAVRVRRLLLLERVVLRRLCELVLNRHVLGLAEASVMPATVLLLLVRVGTAVMLLLVVAARLVLRSGVRRSNGRPPLLPLAPLELLHPHCAALQRLRRLHHERAHIQHGRIHLLRLRR